MEINLSQAQLDAWRAGLHTPGDWPVLAFYAAAVSLLPPNPVCVEIGIADGRSLLFLAETCLKRSWTGARLYGVDPQGRPRPPASAGYDPPANRHTLGSLVQHGSAAELQLIQLVQLESVRAARAFGPASVDLLFLDGDHREEAVAADLAAWIGAIKPGGIIGGDDWNDTFSGVQSAVNRRWPDGRTERWDRIWWRVRCTED